MPITDVYPDLDTLKRSLRENRDYRIRFSARNAPVTIIAPHGGYIDDGTSALAHAIAGQNHNLFDFQGLRMRDGFDLHVTSTRFRDPQLDKIIATSRVSVSVHGMGDEADKTIFLGGLNKELKALMAKHLIAHGFLVNTNSPRFRGESPLNVVNLTPEKGVQLELPKCLRNSMFAGKKLFVAHGRHPKTTPVFAEFVTAVRAAIAEYLAC